jgi:tetratricopeptide (TPR) repeat protein
MKFNMRFSSVIFFLLFSILLLPLVSVQAELNMDSPEVNTIIFTGLRLVYADSTLQAVDEFKKLIDIFPDDPIGYFYVAATLQNVMDDYRNYSYSDEFDKYLNLAIKTAEDRKKKGNLDAYDYLYLGGAIGFRGIHEALTGDWFDAFVDGLKGKGYLEKALKVDPQMYDVYYGLGSYHFWRSLKSRSFWWLPFIGDNRQKGIDMIMLAIEKGKYAKQDAELALVRIWVENKEYDKAFAQIDKLSQIYHNKPYLLWLLGRAQVETNMYSGAIQTYQDLLEALTTSPYYAPAGEVECRYDLALAYYSGQDFKNSTAQIDTILTFKKDDNLDKDMKDFIHKAEDLQKKIKKENHSG